MLTTIGGGDNDRGWSFAEVLPFFRRLERDLDFDDRWHGRDGPVPIRRAGADEVGPLHQAFLDSGAASGYRRVSDHNAPGPLGVGLVPLNTIGGVRQSTALTYLARARGRPNLTVRGGALVDRLVVEAGCVVGVRVARQLARTGPLADLLGAERFPGATVAQEGPGLEEAVRASVDVYFHPVGTCRMGPADDPLAVVDARGRVHGLDGLWVVDASIMPTPPAAGTNLPTIKVAERCAAWLT